MDSRFRGNNVLFYAILKGKSFFVRKRTLPFIVTAHFCPVLNGKPDCLLLPTRFQSVNQEMKDAE